MIYVHYPEVPDVDRPFEDDGGVWDNIEEDIDTTQEEDEEVEPV